MTELLRKLNAIFDRRTKTALTLATLASVVIALLDTIAIALVLPLVNLATGQEDESQVLRFAEEFLRHPDSQTLTLALVATVVTLFILKDVGAVVYAWWLSGFKVLQRVELSSRLLRYFLTSPYTIISSRGPGELIRTMNDAVVQTFGSTVYALMQILGSVISIIAIVIALLITAPYPTMALIGYFVIAALVYLGWVKPKAKRAGVVAADASGEAWRAALAALGALKETHLRGSADHFVGRYRAASIRGAYATRTAEILTVLPRYLLEVLFIIAVGVILGVGVVVNPGNTAGSSVGILALFVAAGFRVLPSVTGLLNQINSVRFGARFLDIVHAEIKAEREVSSTYRGTPTSDVHFRTEIELRNLSFRYPGSTSYALTDVSLRIPCGSTIAFVGGSGAGKTTLIDVVLGLHRPTQGSVCVDGTNIESNLAGWQALIGYVPQDVYLFESTLAQNVAFDETPGELDLGRVQSAIRAAQLQDFVESLPYGLDTQIGERGARLSGGQRQRVGVARALYRRPAVLVLDEATSALDNETEDRLSKAVFGLRGGVTVLIVAHRLSTVKSADRIVFMEAGRVRATGTFDDLRRRDERFARLVALGALHGEDPPPPA